MGQLFARPNVFVNASSSTNVGGISGSFTVYNREYIYNIYSSARVTGNNNLNFSCIKKYSTLSYE